MIKHIRTERFKSILSGELQCGPLNLFTGINGSGKSSFLQTLILIRQSFTSGGLYKRPASIVLGSQESLINLGTYKDVLCNAAPKEQEIINFEVGFTSTNFKFSAVQYSSDNSDLTILKSNEEKMLFDSDGENLFNEKFQYLAAERILPEEDYPRFQTNESLGKRGEYAVHYLEKYGNKDISIPQLSLKSNPFSYSLRDQVNDWMGEISDSIEILAKENLRTNRVELSYRYKNKDGTPSQDQKPQNVGYGITHTLPIIVAILAANPGDLIIIENPESHLHPRGQSRLSHLFALAAANGVQLFIETHSDHLINGLRVAVKKNKVDNNSVFINYFKKDENNLSVIERIRVDEEGGLEKWPDGFFDEWDSLLNELL